MVGKLWTPVGLYAAGDAVRWWLIVCRAIVCIKYQQTCFIPTLSVQNCQQASEC